jgi:hypothetical protein
MGEKALEGKCLLGMGSLVAPPKIGRVAGAGTLYISVCDATQCNFTNRKGG